MGKTNEMDLIKIGSVKACVHAHHTHHSSTLRPVKCYPAFISEVHPNSAVVVPEEFPRGKFGKAGEEGGWKALGTGHPLPSH